MKQGKPKFSTVLAEAVKDGLNSISPSISDVVVFYLQKRATVQFVHSAVDPKSIDEGLKEILGCGAEIVERKILESLHLRLEVKQKLEGSFDFAEEVKKAQKLFSSHNPSMLKQLVR